VKKNPIYLFYEVIANGPDGTPGDDGDVHYCCFHGVHKICTIKKTMRGNLSGAFSFRSLLLDLSHKFLSVLVNNLCIHVKPMYQLYCILKDCDTPLTPDEIDIASAKCRLDETTETEYLQKLQKSSENIKKVFQDQQAHAIVSEIHLAFHRF